MIWHAIFLAADPDSELAAAIDEVAVIEQCAQCVIEEVLGAGRYEPDAQTRFHHAVAIHDTARPRAA